MLNNYQELKKLVGRDLPIEEVNDHVSYLHRRYMGPKNKWDYNIHIGTFNNLPEYLFIVLTHEYGHYLSCRGHDLKEYDRAMILSNNCVNSNKLTMRQKVLIREEELRAWKYGERFVKEKGFKLNNYFYKVKQHALQNYNKMVLNEQITNSKS